jgi:hypothetical protein
MEKVGTKKRQKRKLSKANQYERFLETVRRLGIDEQKSRESFERTFEKIVPRRTPRTT